MTDAELHVRCEATDDLGLTQCTHPKGHGPITAVDPWTGDQYEHENRHQKRYWGLITRRTALVHRDLYEQAILERDEARKEAIKWRETCLMYRDEVGDVRRWWNSDRTRLALAQEVLNEMDNLISYSAVLTGDYEAARNELDKALNGDLVDE